MVCSVVTRSTFLSGHRRRRPPLLQCGVILPPRSLAPPSLQASRRSRGRAPLLASADRRSSDLEILSPSTPKPCARAGPSVRPSDRPTTVAPSLAQLAPAAVESLPGLTNTLSCSFVNRHVDVDYKFRLRPGTICVLTLVS